MWARHNKRNPVRGAPASPQSKVMSVRKSWKKQRKPTKEKQQRKTKERQKEDKRNRIWQVSTTSASSSSSTDCERLNANVSSRDGLRKPQLTSTRHECPRPESFTQQMKPCLNTGTQPMGPADPPTQRPLNTLPEPPPDSTPLLYPFEGVLTTIKPPKAWPPTHK